MIKLNYDKAKRKYIITVDLPNGQQIQKSYFHYKHTLRKIERYEKKYNLE